MTAFDLTILSLAVQCLLYLLLVIFCLRRRSQQEAVARLAAAYAGLSALWVGVQLAWGMDWLALSGINLYVLSRLSLYGLVLLALHFFYLTRVFLRRPGRTWVWAIVAVAWLVVLGLIDSSVLDLPWLLATWTGWRPGRLALSFGATLASWATWMLWALGLAVRGRHRAELPLHRNRLTYWLIAWSLTAAGDLVFFSGQEIVGSNVRLLGTVAAAYVVLTYRLPDVRQAMRRSLSYLAMTVLTVVTYTAGFAAIHTLFQDLPGYDPQLAGAAMALAVALLFAPLLGIIQRGVNRLLAGPTYDPSQTVSQYSRGISNIVDLERLATVAVGLLNEALGIRRGALFVVNRQGEARQAGYEMLPIRGMGQDAPSGGHLGGDSPILHHLRDVRRPLTQFDVDLLPAFHQAAAEERDWLSSLGMDVYVPIHSGDAWLGVLAVGPKISGDRYFDQDLALLAALAGQTAVALENARLVDDLVKLNQDLQNTYLALARANRQLQEMDRLKSAFIGVITHELRSPFVNVAFSLQLLNRSGVENLSPEQREQLEQLTANLKQAKAMVDNLVTFATFLSKQGELCLASVDFRAVVRDSLLALRPMIEGKALRFHVTVPDRLPLVQGDRERLADAVHHLVHNAIKFNTTGGEVWVTSWVDKNTISFEVKDTGIGVPPERLPGLWEGFAQMADPLQRGVEGLGLGLALVKYVVNAHGGRVWAESEPAVGSRFGFELPLDVQAKSQ